MAYTLTYSYSNNAYTVTGYTGTPVDVVIPNTYDDGVNGVHSVTSIGNSAFSSCSSLKSVTIPDSVTSIGGYAFSNCSSLTSVTIPDGVTSIEDYTFCECDNLTSVTIGNSVTSIGVGAFKGVSFDRMKLSSITIPESVISIGDFAFTYCNLTNIIIPESVTSIGAFAFSDCSSLTEVYLLPHIAPELVSPEAFSYTPATFYCLSSSINSYKSGTNWSTYKNSIIADDIKLYSIMNAKATKTYIKNKRETTFNAIEGGSNGQADIYYQSLMFIPFPNNNVGDSVSVNLSLFLDGTYNSYSSIIWVDSVYTVAGGEVKTNNSVLDNAAILANLGKWYNISFAATVRNFPALRRNSQYTVMNTSSYGKGVYVMIINKSSHALKYRLTPIKSWENLDNPIPLYSHFFYVNIGGNVVYLRLTSTRSTAYTSADQIRQDVSSGKVVNIMRNYTSNKVSQAIMLVNADVSPTTFTIVSFSGIGAQYIDGVSGTINSIGTDTITSI